MTFKEMVFQVIPEHSYAGNYEVRYFINFSDILFLMQQLTEDVNEDTEMLGFEINYVAVGKEDETIALLMQPMNIRRSEDE